MASEVLEQIDEARRIVHAAVASIEAATVSGADAERLIVALSGVSKSADAGVTKVARRLEETARWKLGKAPSPEALLGKLTGGSNADGKRLLDTSKRLDELPATLEAMEQGEVSVDQAAQIATAAGELADAGRPAEAEAVEADLLGLAEKGNFASLRDAAERARQAARDETAQRRHLQRTRFHRKRRFDDGGVGGTYKLPPEVAARVQAAMDAETDLQFARARAEGRREGHDAYAADALVELITGEPVPASAALAGSATDERINGPAVVGSKAVHPAERPARARKPRTDILARVDLAALYRGRPLAGELCDIAGVGPVPVGVIRDLLGDALVTLICHDGHDVLNVTRGGRRAAEALRIAVLERHGYVCEDCGSPYGLQIDHTQPWALDGPTSYENQTPKCGRCHGEKTAEEAGVTIRAGRERAELERLMKERVRALVASASSTDLAAVTGRDPPRPG